MDREPDPEPRQNEVAAPGESSGRRGGWNRHHVFQAVDRIDFSRTPRVVRLYNPSVSGDIAAGFIDREARRFYRDPQGQLPEFNCYVVWAAGELWRPEDFAGLHFGIGDRAYRGIVAANQGVVANLEWQRVDTLTEARSVFLRDLEEHVLHIPGFKPWRVPVGRADRIFVWR